MCNTTCLRATSGTVEDKVPSGLSAAANHFCHLTSAGVLFTVIGKPKHRLIPRPDPQQTNPTFWELKWTGRKNKISKSKLPAVNRRATLIRYERFHRTRSGNILGRPSCLTCVRRGS